MTANPKIHTAILEMVEFGCPSCSHAIERFGRRLNGVSDIRVDLASRQIRMEFDGNTQTVQAIQDFVRKIGHEARLRPDERPA
jgi:copper chaperone CopZ